MVSKSVETYSIQCCKSDEDVVISGIAGVFPKCDNVKELAENLFKKVNLVTDFEENVSLGKINDLGKFDAEFFNTNNEHADYMDPMCRILLEKSYEAIYDSGYNPYEFRNTNTAVYVACCTSEAEIEGVQRTDVKGAIICERAQSFLANRISYCLGTHGTSCVLNTACSSSVHALELAFKAIRYGECDAAIVGASNLALSPDIIRSYNNLGISSNRCRSFDDSASGFCKSEAVCAIFLQKERYARRVYAQIASVKTNHDGFKKQSILFPSAVSQTKLINDLYAECGIDKTEVGWVEAHGTGTRVGDYEEMCTLETLCENRTTPLMVGCIKSNIGHTEAASGLCSIIKVIIAMETGFIPPNINYETPQSGINALKNGKIKIVTEATAHDSTYVSVNNFGIGGSNGHVLLKCHDKIKSKITAHDDTMWLVTVSGRTMEAVNCLLTYVETNPIDPEFIGLLHNIHKTDSPHHKFRGYAILNVNGDKSKTKKNIQISDRDRRPSVWFVFPGMGSHRFSLVKQLMNISIFRKSIEECHEILTNKTKNVNLKRILADDAIELFDDVCNSFVGIISVEIALVDTLKSLGIVPDGLIGHSLGEIACGYADGCLSMEEALLAAYYRGYASQHAHHIKGSMCVVGAPYEQITNDLPEDIDIACYNARNNFTLSGPSESICRFVDKMTSRNVTCTIVKSEHIAYHSRYILDAASVYGNYLRQVIKEPKIRSPKWISTSSQSSSNNDSHHTDRCDSNYFYNNFVGPVYFYRALKRIPENSLLLEIGPHSILRTVLIDALPASIRNIRITNKYCTDNHLLFFLTALGRLYQNGVNVNVGCLYDSIAYPVSKGTAMLNSLIGWDHSKSWYVPYSTDKSENPSNISSTRETGKIIAVTVKSSNFRYLTGHVLNGTIVLPEMFYLVSVWQAITSTMSSQSSVHFQDVYFSRVVAMNDDTVKLTILVHNGGGTFEIHLDGQTIVYGRIYLTDMPNYDYKLSPLFATNSKNGDYCTNVEYDSECIYKEFKLRGYHYEDPFRGLLSINSDGVEARVKREENWVAYLNNFVQISFFREYSRDISVVTKIKHVIINPTGRKHFLDNIGEEIKVRTLDDIIWSDDVYISGIEKTACNKVTTPIKPTLQSFEFVPYENTQIFDYGKAVRAVLNIVIENVNVPVLRIAETDELTDVDVRPVTLIPFVKQQAMSIPSCTVDIGKISLDSEITSARYHLLIRNNNTVVNNQELDSSLVNSLFDDGFILTRQNTFIIENNNNNNVGKNFISCSTYHLPNETLRLLRKKNSSLQRVAFKIRSADDGYRWVTDLQNLLKENQNSDIILYAEDDPYSGIIGFSNCLRKEQEKPKIQLLFLPTAPRPFSLDDDFYKRQLDKGLVTNVWRDGNWCFYSSFELEVVRIPSPQLGSGFYYLESVIENDETSARCVNYDNDPALMSESGFVDVYYASLNYAEIEWTRYYDKYTFEDYRIDTLSTNYGLSFEFAGKLDNGTRVMGISLPGSMASRTMVKNCLLWPIPDNWSLEESATVPFSYVVATLLLSEYGEISSGQIVLIKGAAGSYFGKAAVDVVTSFDCPTFVLENNDQDEMFVRKNFPSLRQTFTLKQAVFLKRLIEKETDNRQVDIILNLDDDYHELLIDTLRENGTYLQVGYSKTSNYSAIGKWKLENLRYRSIIVDKSFWKRNINSLQRMKETFSRLIDIGCAKPFVRRLYSVKNLKEACRYYNVRSKFEKVVIEFRNENTNTAEIPVPLVFKFACSERHSYIICGGLGGMGFELARWLVERGARKLILTSRTGKYDDYKRMHIDTWRKHGLDVIVSTADISRKEGVLDLLRNSNSVGPVTAIFNVTLVLKDGLFSNQTEENFRMVNDPKARATKLLDDLAGTVCPEMRYFIVFSSISCGYGNIGQTNYAFGNSVMERICERICERKRHIADFRAAAIEWAAVGEVGYLVENKSHLFTDHNILHQPIKSCLDIVELVLCQQQDSSIVTSFILDSNRRNKVREMGAGSVDRIIQKITGRNINRLPEDATLDQIGLDSINVTEIALILKQAYGIDLKTSEVINLKILDLKSYISKDEGYAPRSTLDPIYVEKISTLSQMYKSLIKSADNLISPQSIVRLPSLLNNGSCVEKPLCEECTIFVLPGIEGLASGMKNIAANVDLQVLCFQYNFNVSSVRDLALSFIPEIKRRLNQPRTSIIMGYSYGGLIALEIARILQDEHTTNCLLYLVDSSPKYIKRINEILYDPENFRLNIREFIKAVDPHVNLELLNDNLNNCSSWQEAVTSGLNLIANSSHDASNDIDSTSRKFDLRTLLTGCINKHISIFRYSEITEKKRLKYPAILIRAADPILQIPLEYDLDRYFTSPIEEFIVPGNHFTMLQSSKLFYLLMNLHKRCQFTRISDVSR